MQPNTHGPLAPGEHCTTSHHEIQCVHEGERIFAWRWLLTDWRPCWMDWLAIPWSHTMGRPTPRVCWRCSLVHRVFKLGVVRRADGAYRAVCYYGIVSHDGSTVLRKEGFDDQGRLREGTLLLNDCLRLEDVDALWRLAVDAAKASQPVSVSEFYQNWDALNGATLVDQLESAAEQGWGAFVGGDRKMGKAQVEGE